MSSSQSNKIPSLDGIRALSVGIVFLSHVLVRDYIPGGFGVTVFFFLSGYLITTLLLHEKAAFGDISFSRFYGRRVLRLMPPLVCTLLFGIILVNTGYIPGKVTGPEILSQLLFCYNYFLIYAQDRSGIEGFRVLWSLSVEEHFYLIYPILLTLYINKGLKLQWFLLAAAVCLVWRVCRLLLFGTSEWVIYTSTDTRFDSLVFGCILALLMDRGSPRVSDRALYTAVVISCLAIAATFIIRDDMFRSTIRYTVQGIALIPLFYFSIVRSNHLLCRPFNWRITRVIGVYSYNIYLGHVLIITLIEQQFINKQNWLLFIPTAAALSILYAAVLYYVVEKPLIPMRRRLNRG